MKRLLAIVLLAASPAFAQTAPKVPDVIEIPAPLVGAIRQYLGARPHDEVNAVVRAIDACVSVQMPGRDGKVDDHGQCPMVSSHKAPAAPMATPAPEMPAPRARPGSGMTH